MSRFCILLACFLTACTQDSDVLRVGSVLLQALGGSTEKIPRERAAAVPYASMGMELGSSAQVLLVLGTATADELDWFAGEQIFVATRHGRVIRTAGLPYDLGGIHSLTMPPVAANGVGTAPTLFSLDFPDLGVFGATAQCSSRDLGEDGIDILGARISTRHIVEHCAVQSMRWNFDNEYWTDKMSGYIWRSSQHIHPKAPPLILEVLRPEQNNQA
jgi:hypothetical protein